MVLARRGTCLRCGVVLAALHEAGLHASGKRQDVATGRKGEWVIRGWLSPLSGFLDNRSRRTFRHFIEGRQGTHVYAVSHLAELNHRTDDY